MSRNELTHANSSLIVKRLSIVVACVAIVGLADATYLTAQHYAGAHVKCFVTSGCGQVLGSDYATIADVPVSAFGALAYFLAFSLALLSAFNYESARKLLLPLVALMFLFTLYLFYLQAFVLHAFCAYCLLSAAVTTTLLILTFILRRVARVRFA